jgi:hypothetical protein
MRAHDVDDDVSTKSNEVVSANDRIFERHEVRAGFVLQQSVHTGSIFKGPFHLRDESNAPESLLLTPQADVVDQCQCPALVEETASQVRIRPLAKVELPGVLGSGRVDSDFLQPSNVLVPAPGIDDLNGLLAAIEGVFDERQQYAVLVVVAGEERAGVAVDVKDRVPEANRAAGLTRTLAVLAAARTHLPAPERGLGL